MSFRCPILCIVLLMAACATPSYMPPNPPSDRDASVQIIRKYGEPHLVNLWIYVDGQKAATLADNSTVGFSASPGKHVLVFDWPPLTTSAKLKVRVDLAAGRAHYFEVTPQLTAVRRGDIDYIWAIQLKELQEEAAKELLTTIGK